MSNASGYIWLAPNQDSQDATTLADKEAIKLYCQANHLTLDSVCVEQHTTGSALERQGLAALLKQEGATIIVPSLAALGRRFHDVVTVLSEINFLGLRMIAVLEDIDTAKPEGKQILKVFVSIPQVAAMMRTPPVDASKTYVRSREVLHNGGTCPYGYTLNEATNQFQLQPLEANVVRRIFRERVSGRSLRQIANELTKDEIATKRGGRWQANTVKTILENIFYTGAYQCQNRIYHNDHEGIIPQDIFEAVSSKGELVQMAV